MFLSTTMLDWLFVAASALGNGQWVFQSSLQTCERPDDDLKYICENWMLREQADPDLHTILLFPGKYLPACPPYLSLANLDPQFTRSSSSGAIVSFLSAPSDTFPIYMMVSLVMRLLFWLVSLLLLDLLNPGVCRLLSSRSLKWYRANSRHSSDVFPQEKG